MAYAIMRAAKINNKGSLSASLQHCFRERKTPNANPEHTNENVHIAAQSTEEAIARVNALLPEKHRKDAVICVEYVLTASPEWWATATPQQQEDFFKNAHTWLANKYGTENIVVATIHTDETTPHMSAYVVPVTPDGRLSAKEFIGNRQKMSDDQTSFAKAVQHLGLERGIKNSQAQHTTIREYYGAQKQAAAEIPILTEQDITPKFVAKAEGIRGWLGTKYIENEHGIATRLNNQFKAALTPIVANAATSRQNTRRAEETQKTLLEQQKELNATQELRESLKGLSSEQKNDVLQLAQRKQAENELKKAYEKALSHPTSRGKGLKR